MLLGEALSAEDPSARTAAFEQVLRVSTKDSTPGAALTRSLFAEALVDQGNELQRALSLVDEGLECVARMTRRVWLPPVNLTPPQVAIGLLGVGAEAHRRLGDHQRQVDLLLRRLEWSRVVAEAEAELETLRLLVDAQTDAGHVDDARRSVIEGLALADQVGSLPERISLQWSAARLDDREGLLDSAVDRMRDAARASALVGAPENVPRCLSYAAALLLDAGRTTEALAVFDEALASAPGPVRQEISDRAFDCVSRHAQEWGRVGNAVDRGAVELWLVKRAASE